jgi:hypothetical protein
VWRSWSCTRVRPLNGSGGFAISYNFCLSNFKYIVKNNPHNFLKNRYKNTFLAVFILKTFLAKIIRNGKIAAPIKGSYTSTQVTTLSKNCF